MEDTASVGQPRIISEETVQRLSGLEQLRGIVEGTLAGPSMGGTLGFRLVAVDEGRAVFSGAPSVGAMNPLGTVHGGWAASILDSALGCAVHATLSPGERYATLELKVNLIRPLMPGMAPLTATGTVISRGRRTAVSEARLADGEGRVCAHGSSTCLIL